MPQTPSREEVAAIVDHTLLKPEATDADVTRLVREAAELGVYAVCVSPSMVLVAKSSVSGCSPNVASLQWEHAIAMRVHAGRCQPEVLPSNDINQDEGGKGE